MIVTVKSAVLSVPGIAYKIFPKIIPRPTQTAREYGMDYGRDKAGL